MLESKAEVAGQIAGTSDTSLEGKFKLLGEADAVDVSILTWKRIESSFRYYFPVCACTPTNRLYHLTPPLRTHRTSCER